MDIDTNNGTGLEVVTAAPPLAAPLTLFNIQVGSPGAALAGRIESEGGPAIYLDAPSGDPLTGSINVLTVISRDSAAIGGPAANSSGNGDGLFIDDFRATGGPGSVALRISEFEVANAARYGARIQDSQGQFNLGTVDINETSMDAISLVNNTNALTRVMVAGGSILDTDPMADAINSVNTALTVNNVRLGDQGQEIGGDGIEIQHTDGVNRLYFISGVNSMLTTDDMLMLDTPDILGRAIVIEKDAASAGTLTASVTGNNLQSADTALFASTNGNANVDVMALNVSGNTFQSVPPMLAPPPLTISLTGANVSPTTNSLRITGFNGNTVTGNIMSGGVRVENATFLTTGGGQVAAGTTTIGDTAARVLGSGLELINPSGSLGFAQLDIFNDATMGAGAGLLVDTKGAGTDFTLETTVGTIDTVGGPAMFLDPLTINMTLDAVLSSNSVGGPTAASAGDGVYLQDVDGSLTIALLTVGTAGGQGLHLDQGMGVGTFSLILPELAISGTGTHGILINDTAGANTTMINIGGLDMMGMGTGGTIEGTGGDGININNVDGLGSQFMLNGVTIMNHTGTTGTITNSTISGMGNVDDAFVPGPVDPASTGTILFNDGVDILQ